MIGQSRTLGGIVSGVVYRENAGFLNLFVGPLAFSRKGPQAVDFVAKKLDANREFCFGRPDIDNPTAYGKAAGTFDDFP
jgi:hypothetical protein